MFVTCNIRNTHTLYVRSSSSSSSSFSPHPPIFSSSSANVLPEFAQLDPEYAAVGVGGHHILHSVTVDVIDQRVGVELCIDACMNGIDGREGGVLMVGMGDRGAGGGAAEGT